MCSAQQTHRQQDSFLANDIGGYDEHPRRLLSVVPSCCKLPLDGADDVVHGFVLRNNGQPDMCCLHCANSAMNNIYALPLKSAVTEATSTRRPHASRQHVGFETEDRHSYST